MKIGANDRGGGVDYICTQCTPSSPSLTHCATGRVVEAREREKGGKHTAYNRTGGEHKNGTTTKR